MESRSVTLPGGDGTVTLYDRFMDQAGNISDTVSDSIIYLPNSALTLSISGDGMVNGTVDWVSGLYCDTERCVNSYANGTAISLMASPQSTSYFSKWSGNCSGSGKCEFAMDADRSVTALFVTLPSVRIGGATPVYLDQPTLQNSYNAAASGAVIEMKSGALNAAYTLTANDASKKSVKLKGGFNATYTSNIGDRTVIPGPVRLRSGTVRFEKVTVK